ncbi:hypothetical protein FHG64_03105 [Antarcticibacterium flavum]|uniref:Lipoprotein n=1 Tax=Antarcticibacterium flavum TaxID=2058175 RepID=A0A5B7WZM0_9FLAO|nr:MULTISPECIES: hypothetical protein [Antarcticibacterium]QCY68457.1 hypothetical protein FHG64_03105 [Antarcticibacterium flavum]
MKKNLSPLLFLVFLILFSCTTSDAPEERKVPEVAVDEDTAFYLALRNDGQLFEIGDTTGEIKTVNKIPGIDFNTVINGVTASSTKLFIYEHEFDPFQAYIHVYNFSNKTSTAHKLTFAEDDFGTFAGLVSMEWDEEKKVLIGLVKENFGENYPVASRVAHIDPVTFKVTPLEIEVEKGHIMGTLLIGNSIYASSFRTSTGSGMTEFFRIDLSNGSVTNLEVDGMTIPPIHLSQDPGSNTVFGFLPVLGSTFMGESNPVTMNLESGAVTYLLPGETTGTKHQFGRSFFNVDTNEHVDIITSPTYNALFRYNSVTQEIIITKLPNTNDLSSMISLVGVRRG